MRSKKIAISATACTVVLLGWIFFFVRYNRPQLQIKELAHEARGQAGTQTDSGAAPSTKNASDAEPSDWHMEAQREFKGEWYDVALEEYPERARQPKGSDPYAGMWLWMDDLTGEMIRAIGKGGRPRRPIDSRLLALIGGIASEHRHTCGLSAYHGYEQDPDDKENVSWGLKIVSSHWYGQAMDVHVFDGVPIKWQVSPTAWKSKKAKKAIHDCIKAVFRAADRIRSKEQRNVLPLQIVIYEEFVPQGRQSASSLPADLEAEVERRYGPPHVRLNRGILGSDNPNMRDHIDISY